MNVAMVEAGLKDAKARLVMIYERKGRTDEEVLLAGETVDLLLNEYERLTKRSRAE